MQEGQKPIMADETDTGVRASKRPRLNRSQRRLVAGPLLVILLGATIYWLWQRHTHVFTEDARIAAEMIEVSSKLAGQVIQFPVSQGDALKPGELIAQIDDRAARFTLQELEAQMQVMQANYEKIEAQIAMVDMETGGRLQAARSKLDAALASLASAQSDLEFKEREWERAQSLKERQIISQQQWENARNAHQQSTQQYQRAQAEVESARASLVEATASQSRLHVLANELRGIQHERDRIRASIDKQKVNIDDLRITSSASGIVDETFVNPGEYVVPGQRLLLMHNPEDIWISANIKETEIRHIHPGNPVDIKVDAYPDRKFTGTVTRIGHAATSQFSLLPSTSPSGNFTKVTQRLPVKISIDSSDGVLLPGMMVEVSIDIR